MTTNETNHAGEGPSVERPVRPTLPEREAARVYSELREMGYTWHQAHETMQRIAAERERCAHLAGELQALRNHVAHWQRAGIDTAALSRAESALREWAYVRAEPPP